MNYDEVENPDWSKTGDWHDFVPEDVREKWRKLSGWGRYAAYRVAQHCAEMKKEKA